MLPIFLLAIPKPGEHPHGVQRFSIPRWLSTALTAMATATKRRSPASQLFLSREVERLGTSGFEVSRACNY